MWAWKNSRTNNLIELAHDFRMEAGKRAPKRGSVGILVCFLGATQVVLERPCYTATQTTVVRERNMKNWIYFAEWSWKIATWGRVFQSAIQPVGTISLLSLSLSLEIGSIPPRWPTWTSVGVVSAFSIKRMGMLGQVRGCNRANYSISVVILQTGTAFSKTDKWFQLPT